MLMARFTHLFDDSSDFQILFFAVCIDYTFAT